MYFTLDLFFPHNNRQVTNSFIQLQFTNIFCFQNYKLKLFLYSFFIITHITVKEPCMTRVSDFCYCWHDPPKSVGVSVPSWFSQPKLKLSTKMSSELMSFYRERLYVYKAPHAPRRPGPMWFLWKTMYLPLVTATEALISQLAHKTDLLVLQMTDSTFLSSPGQINVR